MNENNKYEMQLRNTGIVDAYEHLLKMLCKYGLPKDNVFDFAAVQMMQFEKKWKSKVLKEIEGRFRKRENIKEAKRQEKMKEEEEKKKMEQNEIKKFLKMAKEKKEKLMEEKRVKESENSTTK